jgi:hypothetical protein
VTVHDDDIPAEQFVSLCYRFQIGSGALTACIQWVLSYRSTKLKEPELKADRSLQPSAEVKKAYSLLSLSHTALWRGAQVHNRETSRVDNKKNSRERREIHTKFLLGNLKERRHLECQTQTRG